MELGIRIYGKSLKLSLTGSATKKAVSKRLARLILKARAHGYDMQRLDVRPPRRGYTEWDAVAVFARKQARAKERRSP